MSTAVEHVQPAGETTKAVAVLAEFRNVDSIIHAAREVRKAGYTRFDVHSPFPIHGIDVAMGIRPTILPWLVLLAGLAGLVGALLMQWWMNARDYQFMISGKPMFSLPAFVPIIFECTVLCAAYTAAFGMLMLNRLPMLYNPMFKIERFRRVTSDRFFLAIDATDPKFQQAATSQLLQQLGADAIEAVED
ncbi:MAG: DUF3341 domain-containing protein [Tepidisphaeraceae bacterium]|jgi:hypothetical protein